MTSFSLNCLKLSSQDVATAAVPVECHRLPNGRQLTVHRLDRCHAAQCGNKGPKLIARLRELKSRGVPGVVSVGGAFSNHIHALAAMGRVMGIATVGVIRGTDADGDNPTLADARRWGMTLVTVDRKRYADRYQPAFQEALHADFPDYAFVQEGGNDESGAAACQALGASLSIDAGATLVVASGTGATVRGLALGLPSVNLVGADVVGQGQASSGADAAVQRVDCRYGGYGRVPPVLLHWLSRTWVETGVLFDPLYNGKAAYWCDQQPEDNLHLLHTGGVQGWRGVAARGALTPYPALAAAVAALRF